MDYICLIRLHSLVYQSPRLSIWFWVEARAPNAMCVKSFDSKPSEPSDSMGALIEPLSKQAPVTMIRFDYWTSDSRPSEFQPAFSVQKEGERALAEANKERLRRVSTKLNQWKEPWQVNCHWVASQRMQSSLTEPITPLRARVYSMRAQWELKEGELLEEADRLSSASQETLSNTPSSWRS